MDASMVEERQAVRSGMSSGRNMMEVEVSTIMAMLIKGGWGHQRLEEERRRQEQERLREQMHVETYAMPADIPKGEGEEGDRFKRERSEEDDVERRDDDKRFRGE